MKWLQELLFKTSDSIEHYLFTLSNGSKNFSVWIQFRNTVKEFQVFLFNTNNSIQHYSFICTLLNGSKYCYVSQTIQFDRHLFTQLSGQRVLFLTLQFNINHLLAHSLNVKQLCLINRWEPITPGQSGLGNNGNKRVLHIPQSFRIGASSWDCIVSYPEHILVGLLHLCRDAVGDFTDPAVWAIVKWLHVLLWITIILFNINHSFALCEVVTSIAI